MMTALNTQCKHCKGSLSASIESAAHEGKILDIRVFCLGKCKRVWNTFLKLADMVEEKK